MQRSRDHGISTLFGLVLVAGLAASGSDSAAQDRGVCVTSDVPEDFTLPDGSVHAAGRLTLCTVLALNPVVGLHRVWLDDDGGSLVMSRRARAETTADSSPVLLFRCLPGAPLGLVGYVSSDGCRSWSYALRPSDRTGFGGPESLGVDVSSGDAGTVDPGSDAGTPR